MRALTIITILILTSFTKSDFISDQKQFERVRTAYAEKGEIVKSDLKKNGINLDKLNLLIVVYKDEQLLELYAKNKSDKQYIRLKTYDICAKSGQLGPKRRMGDNQVPEGFYHIERYNPASSYYLSLGVSYPNSADKKKSNSSNLGGDIFIHGECVTIGCMPMTNDKIKEIYIYAIQARAAGQVKIPVYIFPFKMSDDNIRIYKAKYKNQPDLISFWNNIKIGHDKFLSEKSELNVKVDGIGDYVFD